MTATAADFSAQLREILGADAVLTAAADCAPFLTDHRRLYQGAALAVALPRSVAQVSQLLALCHAQRVGVAMPEVGIFDSPEPNAFATGASRNAALVTVSSGLLERMNRQQIEAVLGHEMTHVANGDMVTLTLVQGVVNTFVIFLSRVIGNIIDRAVFRSDDGRGIASFVTVIVLQLLLGILANMIVMWFSRRREFRADRGGAQLAGTGNMIAALEELKRVHEPLPSQQLAAFGIAGGGRGGGLARLFMSHPPLDERIAALRALGSH